VDDYDNVRVGKRRHDELEQREGLRQTSGTVTSFAITD
jgi:hypothetical protein